MFLVLRVACHQDVEYLDYPDNDVYPTNQYIPNHNNTTVTYTILFILFMTATLIVISTKSTDTPAIIRTTTPCSTCNTLGLIHEFYFDSDIHLPRQHHHHHHHATLSIPFNNTLLVQPPRLHKLRNLILTRLIRIRLPHLIQRHQLLRTLHHRLDIHTTLRQPINQFPHSTLRPSTSTSPTRPRIPQRRQRARHARRVPLESALRGLQHDGERHGGDGDGVWGVEKGQVGEVVVV